MSQTSHASSTDRSTLMLGGVVAVLIVVALGFALFGGSGDDSDFDLDQLAAPSIDGAAVTGDGGAAPQVTAPALLTDEQQSLLADGEARMIVFLAHWCPACNAEVPVVTDWLDGEQLPDGVEVRAVATSIDPTRPNYPPDTWLDERDWPVPTLVDTDGTIAEAYGVTSFPTWVFVDASGTVVARSGAQPAEALTQAATALAAG